MPHLELSVAQSMRGIGRAAWDAIAARYRSPFYSWGFLALLEESGSIGPRTGWTPCHFLLKRDGVLIAAAPFYAKTHSMGEFVFDFEFAGLADRLGATYYPKLVGMIPATPVPLWRPLVAEGEDEATLGALLMDAAGRTAAASAFGALQVNWPAAGFRPGDAEAAVAEAEAESAAGAAEDAAEAGRFREWRHASFLWTDEGYGDFPRYLASFSKNMRRNVQRERRAVAEAGIATRMVGAAEARADPRLLPLMADLYEATNDKFGPWGAKFLTRDFFLRLPEFLEDGWLLSAAFRGTEPVALAFLFVDAESLYGRYWGTKERVDGLHFELCYYLPIEYALSVGIRRFDPGMGSEHKARRGFRSVIVPSFHLAFDRRVDAAFAAYLPLLSREEEEYAAALNEELPFKRER